MNSLTELSCEEKMISGGLFHLGPIFFDIIGFVNTVREGFGDGIRDSTKKP